MIAACRRLSGRGSPLETPADGSAAGVPRGGFTLLEVMVVLAMAALAAAVVAPRLDALLEPGPRAPAEELAEAYRHARELATSRSTTATVTVDPRTGAWRLFEGPASGDETAVDGGNLLTDRPETRITGTGGRLAVTRFDARGRAWGPELALRTDAGTHRVEVDVWTGSIRIR